MPSTMQCYLQQTRLRRRNPPRGSRAGSQDLRMHRMSRQPHQDMHSHRKYPKRAVTLMMIIVRPPIYTTSAPALHYAEIKAALIEGPPTETGATTYNPRRRGPHEISRTGIPATQHPASSTAPGRSHGKRAVFTVPIVKSSAAEGAESLRMEPQAANVVSKSGGSLH
jgi:hypothetical protein